MKEVIEAATAVKARLAELKADKEVKLRQLDNLVSAHNKRVSEIAVKLGGLDAEISDHDRQLEALAERAAQIIKEGAA